LSVTLTGNVRESFNRIHISGQWPRIDRCQVGAAARCCRAPWLGEGSAGVAGLPDREGEGSRRVGGGGAARLPVPVAGQRRRWAHRLWFVLAPRSVSCRRGGT